MTRVQIPLCPYLRGFAAVVVPLSSLAMLFSPIAPPYRVALVCVLLIAAQVAWRRYLGSRPISIQTDSQGQIVCVLANGDCLPVARLRIGTVGSRLVVARLWPENGAGVDLFVSSAALAADAHWQLRRLLLDWHQPPAPDDLRGA